MDILISNLIRSVREVEELLEFNEVKEDDKDLFELKRLLDDAISQAYGIKHKWTERILRLKDIDNLLNYIDFTSITEDFQTQYR